LNDIVILHVDADSTGAFGGVADMHAGRTEGRLARMVEKINQLQVTYAHLGALRCPVAKTGNRLTADLPSLKLSQLVDHLG
jgi:hypothetical protein